MMRKMIACLLLILISCQMILCGSSFHLFALNLAFADSRIEISAKRLTLYNGQTTILSLDGTSQIPMWTSSNPKIATINKNGRISAKKPGKAIITAKLDGKQYRCQLTVKPAIIVEPENVTIQVGEKVMIDVTYMLNDTIYWSTNDADIVNCEFSKKWKKNVKS